MVANYLVLVVCCLVTCHLLHHLEIVREYTLFLVEGADGLHIAVGEGKVEYLHVLHDVLWVLGTWDD